MARSSKSVLTTRSKTASSTARHGNPNALAEVSNDPALLLTRGFTARWIGPPRGATSTPANASQRFIVAPLTTEEIDADLRHMVAYDTACRRYHQAAYAHWNQLTADTEQQQLPTKLDPDHDKRLQQQRQAVAMAEWKRHDLEHLYMALRSQYVETCQNLQDVTQHHINTWLQDVVRTQAAVVAYGRIKKQMVVELMAAMEWRKQHCGDGEPSKDTTLTEAFSRFEQSAKEEAQHSNGSTTVQPWKGTVLPGTPRGVPLLLSPASRVPEKSLAWAVATDNAQEYGVWPSSSRPSSSSEAGKKDEHEAFQNVDSLVWLTHHVPLQGINKEDEELAPMIQTVEALKAELQKEATRNAAIWAETAQQRRHLDEWTTRMGLIRQETEAVLYRYNLVMEEVGSTEGDEEEEEHDGSGEDSPDVPESVVTDPSAKTNDQRMDDDEEGEVNKAEEGDWEAEGNSSKRGSAGESPSQRKRRKV